MKRYRVVSIIYNIHRIAVCCLPVLLFLLFSSRLNATHPPKYEIRGIWLTTIYGLDWPTRSATTEAGVKQQKEELKNILDQLQEANFNTVFLQVRLRGDLIYPSAIEPFSSVFAGSFGKSPGYDPLAFAIEECHKRGLQCHAWFVTFPVGSQRTVTRQGKLSVVKKHPALCKQHNGEWYLDPGLPQTYTYLESLVKELVGNYDIDGIHFDYIRYPEQALRFPDKQTYNKYGKGKELAQWRRDNIDRLVTGLYDCVKELKPWVQVSSAPLGKYSRIQQVPNAGWTAYESVYQDPKKWMQSGKHDMVVPMMYYQHENFYPFVSNWLENAQGRLVVPGLGAYRLEKEEGDWELKELTDQIDFARNQATAGTTFFRCAHLLNDTKGLFSELKNNYFHHPALLPPLHWLNDSVPEAPYEIRAERIGDELKLTWDKMKSDEPLTYTVYYSLKDSIDFNDPASILATGLRDTVLYLPVDPNREVGITLSITTSSRYQIESCPSYETYYYWTDFIK